MTSVRRRSRSARSSSSPGPGGTRTVEAADFFVDLFETAIGDDEILTEVRIPKHTGWGAHYEKFVRVAHQWPIVAVAATVKGSIDEARVGLTNMGSTPLRATATEQALAGASATEDGVREAVAARRRGHQPALGPQRRRRLPPAPRAGADRSGRAQGGGGADALELSHRFTVPIGVEETWAHFNDIASVAECFPGAQVTEADEESFSGSVKVKLGPIALVYNGSGTFVEKDEEAHRFVVDAKGKDKRGNGTAGAKVTVSMAEAGGSTDVDGGDRPGHHRQAGAVRARGDAGRLRQAARAVRRLPRAAAGRARRVEPTRPTVTGRRVPGGRRACRAAGRRRGGRAAQPSPPTPPAAAGTAEAAAAGPEALDLGSAVLPVLAKSYWKQALAALVVLVLLRRLLRRS